MTAPARTRPVGLYRLLDDRPFAECWEQPEVGGFDFIEVPDLGEALLVYGQSEPAVCGWVGMVNDLTGMHLDEFTTTRASALLFVRVNGHSFALSFGDGYRRLVRAAVDRGFGLALALRVVDADTVRHIKREHLTGTGRVETGSVPGGDTLWSYGIREHSELVRRIVGSPPDETRLSLSHFRRPGSRRGQLVGIDFADRVRLPLPHSADQLIEDLSEIVRVLDDGAVDEELAPLQWIRRLGPSDQDRIDLAWSAALQGLVEHDDVHVSLAHPPGYHGAPEISRFVIRAPGRPAVETDEINLSYLVEPLDTHATTESRMGALTMLTIRGFGDDGLPISGPEPALNWLTATVDLPDGGRVVLLDGEWFEITDAYLARVDRVIRTAFARRPDWALPAWRSARPDPATRKIDERQYNEHAGAQPGFLCLDRKLVRCRTHRRGFEACDLLGPDNELVHVKRVSSRTGSGPLSHLVAQGIVAIESLTDPATWAEFIDLVRAQDPQRAAGLGNRPAALVYAIHRQAGPLTPDNLFTFARSELAAAEVLITRLGIPLQICVIP